MDIFGTMAGKVVLIPGASGGIGSLLAQRLLEAGANIAAGYVQNKEKLEDLASKHENQLLLLKGELQNKEIRSQYLDQPLSKWGQIDALIDCSGLPCRTPLAEIEAEELDHIFQANSLGPLLLARDAAQIATQNSKITRIVFFSSLHAPRLTSKKEIYALTKRFVSDGLLLLAREFPQVRINEIILGVLGMGMSEATKSTYPAGSRVSVEDLLNSVDYLISEKSGSLTGSKLRLDKGESLPYT